jgi:transposase, IS5 family
MYRKPSVQVSVYEYVSPLGRGLDPENRWVRLSDAIPWDDIEASYAAHFRRGGAPAKPSRFAFGALLIQKILNTSDAETVAQITENPYLQYFIGITEFQTNPPFNPSLMSRFRNRIDAAAVHGMMKETQPLFARRQ